MKQFAINLLLFAIPICCYPFFLWAYNELTIPNDEHACYLWGDSQMVQGLDLTYLHYNSRYSFFSSAQYGAGIYNFLVFTEIVPENSFVIISISRTVLLRRKEKDKIFSAIDIKSINKLIKKNYSFKEISRIIIKNLKPHKIFYSKNQLSEDADSIVIGIGELPGFKSIYEKRPVYFDDKKDLYFEGLQTLINKKCRIFALVFPYHPILNEIESNSPYHNDLVQFDNEISKCFSKSVTIKIKSNKTIFNDLTHLNKKGALSLSEELIRFINSNNQSLLIKIIQSQE
jgi:hypothetical protein